MSFRNNKHARYISANIEIISGLKSLNITQDGENVDLVALVRTLMGRISALESAAAASATTARAATTNREKLQGYMEKKLEKRLETLEKKAVTLAELADVDVSDLSDGATLGYDATSQRWTPFVDEVSDDAVDDLADDLELITTD